MKTTTTHLKRIGYFLLMLSMTAFFVACSDDEVGVTPLDDAYYMCNGCMQGLNNVLMTGVGKDYNYQSVALEISLQIQGQGGYIDWLGYPQGGQVVAQGFLYNTGAQAHYSTGCGLAPGSFYSLTTLQPGENIITGPDGRTFNGLVLAINGDPSRTITMNATFTQGQVQDVKGQVHAFNIHNYASLDFCGTEIVLE